MVKAYTQILIEPHVRDRFRLLKKDNTYSDEIMKFLDIKEKVVKNEKVLKKDLNVLKE